MPRLHEFDDYDGCPAPNGRFEGKVPDYCVISVHVTEPSEKSRLYNFIKNFSSMRKQHFNHTELKRGICMQTCFEVHEKLGDYSKYQNENSPIFGEQAGGAAGIRNIYNKLTNICINKKLMEKYGLSPSISSIDYCVAKNESNPFDIVDYLFMVCFVAVALVITLAAFYERKKNGERVAKFFERFRRTRKFVNAFSLQQNWRLLMESDSNENRNLVNLHALKVLIMFSLVFIQVYRHIASLPFANPIDIEKVKTNAKFLT